MKKGIIISVLILLLVLALAFFLKEEPVTQTDSEAVLVDVDIYLLNDTESSLVTEKKSVKTYDGKDLLENVVKGLIEGPANTKNVAIAEKETKVNSITKLNGDVTVDFSREFLSGDKNKETLAVYAVVKTLSQLSGVSRVKVTVDGEALVGADSKVLDFLSGEDINMEKDESVESKYVTLYFPQEDETTIDKEIRTLKITDNQPLEYHIVSELIKGPQQARNKPVLSADTSVISAETTDGICFVNFNQNFMAKNPKNDKRDRAIIYSIVNSLTESESVTGVQLLVEGKKVTEFGTMDISGVFQKDEQITNK